MDRHEIKYPDKYLDDALAAKPDFDKMKQELQTFVANKDYKGIKYGTERKRNDRSKE